LGARLLQRFVPRVEASAALCQAGYAPRDYYSCWQCGGGGCEACCKSGAGCYTIKCY
jgi:hypothetical protein